MKFELSTYGELSLESSPINKMTETFSRDFREGIDINLGVGYVNDETIPNQELLDCFKDVLNNTSTYKNPLNYGAAAGSLNLQNAIKEYYCNNTIGDLQESDFEKLNIHIGANGATSILDAISDILPKGIIFTVEPMYYIYTETLIRKGFTICPIPEDSEGAITGILEQKLQEIAIDTISFFYFITVNNPSTIILSNKRKKEIVDIATKYSIKRGKIIPVIFDKAYEDIIYNNEVDKPISALLYDTIGNIIEVGTLSKLIAPALRIGYAISKKTELFDALIQRTNDIGFSAPLINQEISANFLKNNIEKHREKVNIGYLEKATKLTTLIEKHIGEQILEYSGGKAGFYFYITFKEIETHSNSDFYKFLTRTTGDLNIDEEDSIKKPRLIYIPGEICVQKNGEFVELGNRQLRISFGFEDISVLEKAILLMKDAIEYIEKKSQLGVGI